MVYWITGRSGSGKTTLARRLQVQKGGIILDGEWIREIWPTGYSTEERHIHLVRICKIAMYLERQGHTVIISCISPNRVQRRSLQQNFRECIELYLPGGIMWQGTTYEEPEECE